METTYGTAFRRDGRQVRVSIPQNEPEPTLPTDAKILSCLPPARYIHTFGYTQADVLAIVKALVAAKGQL